MEPVQGRTRADADALHRILRALASEGVFAEESRGVFRKWRELLASAEFEPVQIEDGLIQARCY